MRRVEVDLVELQLGVEVDAARGHEAQRAVDLGRERFVPPTFDARVEELEVPRVHARQVGEPSLGEGAQEVERRGGLVVDAHETRRDRRDGPRASNAKSFTMSPRKDGSSMPSRTSVGDERGFANWPAILPIFTVGTPLP